VSLSSFVNIIVVDYHHRQHHHQHWSSSSVIITSDSHRELSSSSTITNRRHRPSSSSTPFIICRCQLSCAVYRRSSSWSVVWRWTLPSWTSTTRSGCPSG